MFLFYLYVKIFLKLFMFNKRFLKILLIGIFLTCIPCFVFADELLDKKEFNVDSGYDLNGREKTTAVLQKVTSQLYFYLDSNWWDNLDIEKRKEANKAIEILAQEFESRIHPILGENYGFEARPGIDNDSRITVLVHPMIENAAGYFNPSDGYPKSQVAKSNQREMLYLSTNGLISSVNKSLFAHEFTHLITFNKKDLSFGISEETWLNEARSEYAPTLLGYDKDYSNSNLQRRVKIFVENPHDSLTEWEGKVSDYGALNLFIQYLVDYYGKEILINSLHSNKIGIASLNEALQQRGFKEDFSKIFTDWTIAIFVNNCSIGPKYCYLNENLRNFKITPFIYYLPTNGESTLSVGYSTKDWSGNWQKIIGGQESLKLDFTTTAGSNFKVAYIIETATGTPSVNFMNLDQSQRGIIYATDGKIVSLTIIPSAQTKIAEFTDKEAIYQFSWSASSEKSGTNNNSASIKELQDKIAYLTSVIANLQAQLAAVLGNATSSAGSLCSKINNNLSFGMNNNQEVSCLQRFLKNQGSTIYPEGMVTGNFLSKTQAAVIRFQEKYKAEILTPLGLEKGTGFVGVATRSKINQMISSI